MGGRSGTPAGALRTSRSMALGTIASRGTGFLRTLIIGVAIGTVVGDAYDAANTIPNIIYELLLGGVLNNVVLILTGSLFIAVTQTDAVKRGNLTSSQEILLAAGTTLGIVAQTIGLFPALRRTGFRFRLRLDLAGSGLTAAARLAGWVF